MGAHPNRTVPYTPCARVVRSGRLYTAISLKSEEVIMNESDKIRLEEDAARKAIENWKTCPLEALAEAAKVFDSATLLMAYRLGMK